MTYGMNYVHEDLTLVAPVEPRYEVAAYNSNGFALGNNVSFETEANLSSWLRGETIINLMEDTEGTLVVQTHLGIYCISPE